MELIRKVLELFDSFQGRLFRYALAFSLLLTIAPILIAVILVFKYVVIINEGAYQFLVEILIRFLPEDIIVLPYRESSCITVATVVQ